MSQSLTYAAISPVRNEESNLARLADCLCAQTVRPAAWVIVDNGSEDGTVRLGRDLARRHSWIRVASAAGELNAAPGAPVVRAFHAGVAVLDEIPDVVVKLDADTSFAEDHFERLLAAFTADPKLGIAGSVCLEYERDAWRPTYVTGPHVRGAVRAYRRECLEGLLPLPERMGWDSIDELKAQVDGWSTRLIPDVSFLHHRKVGERDTGRASRWRAQGSAAHFMGYRFGYLVLRSLYQARRDPRALAMITAYLGAALRREPVLQDERVRAQLRRQQRLAALRRRAREAAGRVDRSPIQERHG